MQDPCNSSNRECADLNIAGKMMSLFLRFGLRIQKFETKFRKAFIFPWSRCPVRLMFYVYGDKYTEICTKNWTYLPRVSVVDVVSQWSSSWGVFWYAKNKH